jgi:hypothetical protein
MQHSATMERLAQAERERDQAAERCEALQREAGRSGREAELAALAAQAQVGAELCVCLDASAAGAHL